jgi:hypothetical protein
MSAYKKGNLLLRSVLRRTKLSNRRFLMNNVDASRLERFRQFKEEIHGSTEYLVVGIDVAKEKHHGFFGTATGKTLLR